MPVIAADNTLLSNIIVSLDANKVANATQFIDDYAISSKYIYSHVFTGFSATVQTIMLEQLIRDQRVLNVSEDGKVKAIINLLNPTAGCSFLFGCQTSQQQSPWGIIRIGADATENTGAGVRVYVIDTGIDSNHADLAANVTNGYSVERCLGLSCANTWDDDQGHRTHVAGTVCTLDNNLDAIGVTPAPLKRAFLPVMALSATITFIAPSVMRKIKAYFLLLQPVMMVKMLPNLPQQLMTTQ
jgi:subtilisin